jgi:hypothetical protein
MISATLSCDHGPAVLLATKGIGGAEVQWNWACSFSRDGSECAFQSQKASAADIEAYETYKSSPADIAKYLCAEQTKPVKVWRKKKPEMLTMGSFCVTCGELCAADADTHRAQECKIVAAGEWQKPTDLLVERSERKSYAQFFFSADTVQNVDHWVNKCMGAKRVVCMGCPRLHEHFLQSPDGINSLLLDLDGRLSQFYSAPSARTFHRFNMNNCRFLDSDSDAENLALLHAVFARCDLVLIDPPFGVRVELLANTLAIASAAAKRTVPLMLFLPSFHKPRVVSEFAAFGSRMRMLDFEVGYLDNPFHQKRLRRGKARRSQASEQAGQRSPVRIFTDAAPLSQFLPPAAVAAQYTECAPCEKFVHRRNQHCAQCGDCVATDLEPYAHCDDCGRCNKAAYRHCEKCGTCVAPDTHPCFAARRKKKRRPNKRKAGAGGAGGADGVDGGADGAVAGARAGAGEEGDGEEGEGGDGNGRAANKKTGTVGSGGGDS